MPVINVYRLSFAYPNGKRLFDEVSFRLERGQRAALVGSNGAGKSTLLSLLAGQLKPDAGEVEVQGEVAWVRQLITVYGHNNTHDDDTNADDDDDDLSVEEWLDSKAVEGFLDFDAVHRIVRALRLRADAVVGQLSHGQRYKLQLCAAVLRPGVDLLLLDEPTSHLSLATVLFLESVVCQCGVACLIVSHDARFLQATVGTVLELDAGTQTLRSTTASFDDYLIARDRRRKAAQAALEAKEKRVSALEKDIRALKKAGAEGSRYDSGDKDKLQRDFHRDRAGRSSTAAGVKERQKKRTLDAEDDSDVPADLLTFDLTHSAKAIDATGDVQLDSEHSLSLEAAEFGFDGDQLFGPVTLHMAVGQKILLLGDNGCGKSTTMAALAGRLVLHAGLRSAGRGVALGVLEQGADCGLDARQTPLEALEAVSPLGTSKRDGQIGRLRGVGIARAAASKPIGQLSPGLVVRLALLLLTARGVNVLLLDEVTNFIDRAAKEILLPFISSFPGAILCITHDRELIEAVEWDQMLLMSDQAKQIEPIDQARFEEQIQQAREEAKQAVSILFD